jgi:hypothetical protein
MPPKKMGFAGIPAAPGTNNIVFFTLKSPFFVKPTLNTLADSRYIGYPSSLLIILQLDK